MAAPLPRIGLPSPLVLGLAGPAERVSARQDQIRELILSGIAKWRASLDETGLG